MPVFRYQGYDQSGLATEGVIEADGHRDAVIKIKSRGILPKQVEEAASGKKILSRTPSPLLRATITRRLATLIAAGVPLVEAISAIAHEQKGAWSNILVDIKDNLAGGSSLARAMSAHPDIFPDFYTGMIAAGESSGKLGEVLLKIADFLETDINIKNKVRTALVYPVFMACVSIFIVLFLFTFVIPKITKIFEDTATSLPLITVILVWISWVFKKFWWLMLGGAAGAVFLYRKIRATRKDLIDRLLLGEPTGVVMDLYMLRFTLTMGFLLSGGLPILRAMRLTGKATGNIVLEDRVVRAEGMVSEGVKLSASLEGFPPTLLQIISTGEKTGRLPEILLRTADSYEAEFDRKLQRAISLLEPVLILTMGLVVGFIVVAVLLPIFELNQVMQ